MNIHHEKSILKRPISGIIGRTSSPLTSAMLLSSSPLMPGPSPEDFKKIYEGMSPEQLARLKGLNVNLNSENLFKQWENIQRNENIGPFSKAMGSAIQPYYTIRSSLARADHYNPVANSVTLYTNNPASMAHELGHAEDFKNKLDMSDTKIVKDGIGAGYFLGRSFAPLALYQEAAASTNAMKNSENIKRDFAANRLLGSAIGTYGASYYGAGPILDYEDKNNTFDWVKETVGGEGDPNGIGEAAQDWAENLSVPLAGSVVGGLAGGLIRPFTIARKGVELFKNLRKPENTKLKIANYNLNGYNGWERYFDDRG